MDNLGGNMEIPTDSIVKFLERTRTANRSRSKEIRLTLEEAHDLALNIAQIQTYHLKLFEKIQYLEETIKSMPITINATGGKF